MAQESVVVTSGAIREFPRYKCHKEVRALKISSVVIPSGRPGSLLYFEEGFPAMEITSAWRIQNNPKAGGYFVLYEDGYTSYSPAEPFEAGYARIPA